MLPAGFPGRGNGRDSQILSGDFEFDFEEIANGIYGKIIYRTGKATVFNLSAADFASYTFDEEAGKYQFEGQFYDDNAEIFEMMLKRKMINVEL